jgi:hypothetical protein
MRCSVFADTPQRLDFERLPRKFSAVLKGRAAETPGLSTAFGLCLTSLEMTVITSTLDSEKSRSRRRRGSGVCPSPSPDCF